MSLDDAKTLEQLTPDARRQMLRAFADRMLLKVSAMDDPADLPGVERAVRTATAIERIYSRCDRAEHHTPDPRKLEAERAQNAKEAVKARVHLADTLKWGEQRQKDLGKWWDAADTSVKTPATSPAPVLPESSASTAPEPTSSTDIIAAATAAVTDAIDTAVNRCAQWAGVWPDGARYLPGQSGWRKHTLTAQLILPDDDHDPELWLGMETLSRANAIARHAGRLSGAWPDGKPYNDSDPDYFQLSANFSTGIERPAPTEHPGPDALPWWIVRKPPP